MIGTWMFARWILNEKFRLSILDSSNNATNLIMNFQRSKFLKCDVFLVRTNNSLGSMGTIESNIEVPDKLCNV